MLRFPCWPPHTSKQFISVVSRVLETGIERAAVQVEVPPRGTSGQMSLVRNAVGRILAAMHPHAAASCACQSARRPSFAWPEPTEAFQKCGCATPCDEKLTIAVVVAGGAGNGGCLWGGGPGGAGGSNRSSISVIPLLERGVMVEPECSQQAVPRPNVANAHFGAAAAHLWQHAATESATVWL